ncbi:hypothetical protein DUNSADRAFT_12243, partial [Dunaliella salina]
MFTPATHAPLSQGQAYENRLGMLKSVFEPAGITVRVPIEMYCRTVKPSDVCAFLKALGCGFTFLPLIPSPPTPAPTAMLEQYPIPADSGPWAVQDWTCPDLEKVLSLVEDDLTTSYSYNLFELLAQ